MKKLSILSFLLSCLSLVSYASQPAPQSPFNQKCSVTYTANGRIFAGISCAKVLQVFQQSTPEIGSTTLQQFQICLKNAHHGAKQCYSPRTNISCTEAAQSIAQVQAATITD